VTYRSTIFPHSIIRLIKRMMGAYRTSRRGQQTNPEPDPLQEEESILNNIRVNERINAREERERGGDLSSLLSFTILLSLIVYASYVNGQLPISS
jgi:hypothetical protein